MTVQRRSQGESRASSPSAAHGGTQALFDNRKVVLTRAGDPFSLNVQAAPRPTAGRGKVVVRVEAAGVSRAEVQLVRGLHPFPPRLPSVPGYDLVGRISQVGGGVRGRAVGDRVAAMPRHGAWQDYVELPAAGVYSIADDVSAAEAVSLVCNGVTAWQMLHRRARTRSGGTILVYGAAGGVGSLLTALAALHGIRVIGTASAWKHDIIRQLGGEPVDHGAAEVSAAVRRLAPGGVDAVFDHLGGANLQRSWELLAPGGTLVSYDSSVEGYEPGQWFRPHVPAMCAVLRWKLQRLVDRTGGRRATMFYVRSGKTFGKDLSRLIELLRGGTLHPPVTGRYRLEDAAEALRVLESRATAGKLVLEP